MQRHEQHRVTSCATYWAKMSINVTGHNSANQFLLVHCSRRCVDMKSTDGHKVLKHAQYVRGYGDKTSMYPIQGDKILQK